MNTVKFEKIVSEGKALGYSDGRACFCVGPLPGETAEVAIIKQKKNFIEAALLNIIEPSAHRQTPLESHFLSCSPWQGVDYAYQLELKRALLQDAFGRPGLELEVTGVLGAQDQTGYRNKLEFSLLTDSDKSMSLAFHARSSDSVLIGLPDGCLLGSPAMNAAALGLLERLNKLNISGYIASLTVRQSHSSEDILGIVTFDQVPKRDWSSLASPDLAGIIVARLRHGREEIIWNSGITSLTDKAGGIELDYPFDGFFQTNIPMFEHALKAILAAVPKGGRIFDLYGGAGAIGIPAAKIAAEVIGFEIDKDAVVQANANAVRAGITNYTATATASEYLDTKIMRDADAIIVDPPRAGLGERVVNLILEASPARIIYLSCNPVTQARDIMMLAPAYKATSVAGFDCYPSTLHIESLIILERVNPI